MTTIPNTLCKEVKDISFCMDCVSYRHCEAVFMWIIKTMVKSYPDQTKQVTNEVTKDWDEILRGAIDVDNMYRRMDKMKKGEHKDE